MCLPKSEDSRGESKRHLIRRVPASFKDVFTHLLGVLLPICTFPYYSALRRNTLDAVQAIIDERDPSVRNDLVCNFLRFKINESRYVQVAGAVLFTSANSALSWDNIAESHWTARTLFYSCIILSLVAIVTGAQQQMVLPGDDPHLQDMDLAQIIATITGTGQSNDTAKNHNYGLIFALQAPLMLFSLAVAVFLAGLFSVVFGPLGSSPSWGDNAKIAIFFGVVNVITIIAFAGSSWWIYEIPKLRPRRIDSNNHQETFERE